MPMVIAYRPMTNDVRVDVGFKYVLTSSLKSVEAQGFELMVYRKQDTPVQISQAFLSVFRVAFWVPSNLPEKKMQNPKP